MLLWNVATGEGRSQRELADALRLPSSRIVGLVDALESEGLIERRPHARDRRARAIHLTPAGRAAMRRIATIGSSFEQEQSRGLTAAERATLVRLLTKVARSQKLAPRVHPGF